ncbi:hypothetical protein Glove_256g84 [Diversispora epigaea]|uniref:Uncharacterized protein n=1 Tax=Diversispora epigaea TaxID=1348612 RepID=A0A397I9V0_9GLOM|nr:hypothetical protein Glove_256g84 [Diversispora epigaea]
MDTLSYDIELTVVIILYYNFINLNSDEEFFAITLLDKDLQAFCFNFYNCVCNCDAVAVVIEESLISILHGYLDETLELNDYAKRFSSLKEEISYCYQHGIGTTKDEVKVFHMGQNNLANCYHDGIGTTERS